jgi:hypothetical protein
LFNANRLVADFDAAYQASAILKKGNPWAVMGALLNAHLSGSDMAAVGGDLAYQFGQSGGLAGIGLAAAQSSLTTVTDMQTLHSRSQLEQGVVRLS